MKLFVNQNGRVNQMAWVYFLMFLCIIFSATLWVNFLLLL